MSFFGRKNLNLDISNKCALECPRCFREYFNVKGMKIPGRDLTLDEMEKITNFFNRINFCGQLSDPTHHPQFIEILKMCGEKAVRTVVHNASSGRPERWYKEAFKANPKAQWTFGIDGLPEDSWKYRKNQDGEKLYEIMLLSKEYLVEKPTWQYIAFNYNENDIDKARAMAARDGVNFLLLKSSRWWEDNDPYRPSNPELSYGKRI